MARRFETLPENAKDVKPYTVYIPDEALVEFKALLKASKIAVPSYENTQEDRRYGVPRSWMIDAKEYWLNKFDCTRFLFLESLVESSDAWEKLNFEQTRRECEKRINSFPNFMIAIEDDGAKYDVHFVALFSKNPDAIPVMSVHGWPGSFLEYLPLMSLAAEDYTPETLPYHLIVPSMPSYTLSSGPPVDKSLEAPIAARILDKLMAKLGFIHGYISTGGDIGSIISRILASKNSNSLCKGMLTNFCAMRDPPPSVSEDSLDEQDKECIQRGKNFLAIGFSYAMEQGTRTSMIGQLLSSNPLALLAWLGDKYLRWTDKDPSLDTILEVVSLYWFTDTIPRCLWFYRQPFEGKQNRVNDPELFIEKPFGYSLFPKELLPAPKAWVETTGNLSFFRRHQAGGHFAQMEQPVESKQDLEEFLQHVRERGIKFFA